MDSRLTIDETLVHCLVTTDLAIAWTLFKGKSREVFSSNASTSDLDPPRY